MACRVQNTEGRAGATFSVQEAKRIVDDLFEPNQFIYWADFLATLAVAYGFAALYLTAPTFSWEQGITFVIAGLALFRAGVFIHEIVHMPKGRMTLFKAVWNVLYGGPMLTPSFMYKNHADHHNWRHYGTARDGEYLPLGAGPPRQILGYLAQVPLLPAFAILRFLVLGPLSWVIPGLRRWVLERASSYVCNPGYRRELPPAEKRGLWVVMEVLCFLSLATVFGLAFAGMLSWGSVADLYVLGMFAAGLNWIRNLVAHRYVNGGEQMTYVSQLTDSINIPGHPVFTELLFPVGLRYHALHHLFPALPYHALGAAHRRLMARLPADSPYRTTVRDGFLPALNELLASALDHQRRARDKSIA
jgi:fatty acid desaturase